VFIGEAPGRHGADRTGVPFSGDKSGRLLWRILAELGLAEGEAPDELPRLRCFVTNVVRCCPPLNRTPTLQEQTNCAPFLDTELTQLAPSIIVPIGRLAFGAVAKRYLGREAEPIRQAHAVPLYADGRAIVPMVHPSRISHAQIASFIAAMRQVLPMEPHDRVTSGIGLARFETHMQLQLVESEHLMAPQNEPKRDQYAEGQNRYEASDRVLKTDDPGTGEQGVLPNLKARVLIGVFDALAHAQSAIRDLEGAGYPKDDISLVMQRPGSPPEVDTSATEADKGMTTGVSVGAILGGIAGLAALAIPGVGAILAAGPIAAALGAMSGAALGGLVGAFSGLGIPKEEATALDEAVRAGGIVVAVKVADTDAEARARALMEQHQPRQLGSYNQAL
jgi:DNA polymerase